MPEMHMNVILYCFQIPFSIFILFFIRHGSITENTIEMLIFCDSPFIYHFGSNILRVNAEVRGGISVPGKEKTRHVLRR